ncbi:glycosylphosphatidylinositol-anchored high density lipoprotein-binding protein 1 isoform X1 [Lagenorhynchus albirostris]|uniref:glycosylphosphatidylinositol-anchored high density lipoprotein-binding protein 1 isoform X1 n=1 Tax=Lagenorhynchus albirostris TaxID=27610 RepID=UPI0028E8A37B|nr:glycosylphosphatidylinositol-anchored high density lipoprotein-binding protein 1 isoform X1 [Lagenorhynchus albirostris]XP_059984016.1 glycosylphosphatidylinositol-anchored high density lipoprotein-binding protein 1 isoform X1 [Lagenorhynchus albirostris]
MKVLVAVLLALLLCGQQASVSSSVKWTGHPDGYGPAAVKGQHTPPSVAGKEHTGRGRMQEVEDDDLDAGPEGYDEDDDEEDDEASVTAGSRGTVQLRCYSCQSLHRDESCRQMQSCILPKTCKTIISHWNTESGPRTTYSGWCADTCQPISRTVDGSLTTISCCQASLCNIPPWQDPQGSGAGGPQGRPSTVATALLFSLLASLQAMVF